MEDANLLFCRSFVENCMEMKEIGRAVGVSLEFQNPFKKEQIYTKGSFLHDIIIYINITRQFDNT